MRIDKKKPEYLIFFTLTCAYIFTLFHHSPLGFSYYFEKKTSRTPSAL